MIKTFKKRDLFSGKNLLKTLMKLLNGLGLLIRAIKIAKMTN